MDTDLTAIKPALADISNTELAALIDVTNGVPQTAPRLLAWIVLSGCGHLIPNRPTLD